MSYTMIYVKNETRTRLRALASLDDRKMVDFLDRLLRNEFNKIDTSRYNRSMEKVTAGPDGS